MTPEHQARELVLGQALSPGKYATYALGLGFFAIVFAFIPLFGVIIGILVALAAWKYVKTGTMKLLSYVLAAVMVAVSFTSWVLLSGPASAGITSQELINKGGVYAMFGYPMKIADYTNTLFFKKPATQDWATFQGWGSPTVTTTPAGGAI